MENNEKYQLRSVFWEATLRCNALCEFCGSRCGEVSSEKLLKNEVESTTVLKCFDEISRHMNPKDIMINVTGGEPLLRKDLFEIMSTVSELGFPWGMVTNGTLIDQNTVSKMQKSNMKTISISLDGLPKTHNAIRKLSNGFQKIEKAVSLLSDADFLDEIQITTVVNHKNIDELEALFSILKTWSIHSWRLAVIDSIGRAEDSSGLMMTKDDYQKYFEFFNTYQFNGSITLMSSCSHYLGQYDNLYRPHDFSCDTGKHIASILANGDIFVCPNVSREPDLIQGNINKDSFVEVWEKGFKWFRNPDRQKSDNCSKCSYYEKCRGDSLHTWDFSLQKPKFCFKDLFHEAEKIRDSEKDIKQKVLSYYSDLKGLKISYENSSDQKLIFTPSATHDFMTLFSWGEKTPSNCFELLVGLVGFAKGELTVVEHIIPGKLVNRMEETAGFSNESYYEILKETDLLNMGRKYCDKKFCLSEKFSFVGIAHSHPLELSPTLSIADIKLHNKMRQKHSNFFSVILNPQKKQLAVYANSVFTPIDVEFLCDNISYCNRMK